MAALWWKKKKEGDGDGKALVRAALDGHTDEVQALLDKGVDVNAVDKRGSTALMVAAWKGHSDIVKLLLDRGADVNLKKGDDGSTALMVAALEGHSDIVKALLDKGADVNARCSNGETVVAWAAKADQTEMIKLLKEAGATE